MERFAFTVVQAEAILQMRLQRLTGLERQELEDEHARLTAEITEYRRILSDEKNVAALIREDMVQLEERFPEPRKTSIEEAQGEIATLDLVVPENLVVTLSHEGYVKRTPIEEYRKQRRGGKGIRGTESKEGDFVEHLFVANTHDWLLFFTDRGPGPQGAGPRAAGAGPLRPGPGAGELPAAGGGGEGEHRAPPPRPGGPALDPVRHPGRAGEADAARRVPEHPPGRDPRRPGAGGGRD